MSDELPQGWATTPLSQIAEINPRHPKGLDDSMPISFARMTALSETKPEFESLEERTLGEVRKGFTHFAEGDVLFAKITPCMENGKGAVATGLRNGIGCGTTELHVIRPLAGIDPHYIYRFLGQAPVRRAAKENFTGTAGQARVPTSFIEVLEMPLAPLNEQRRIVAKLETLLGKVDACQQRLAKIPVLLKRFRQSVLAAACSGRLTADWREENSDLGTGDDSLRQVQPERRQIWERVELRKMIAGGRVPADDKWKKRYEPPPLADMKDGNDLPSTWIRVKLDAVLAYIEAGKSFTCDERPPKPNEVGVLKVSAVSWGEFDEQESKTCRDARRVNSDIQVRVGDFLFSRANTIELVGACVIVKQVSSQLMLSDKTLRLHFAGTPNTYILCALRSAAGRAEIERLATGNQNSMRNIGQERIREIAIPFPPLPEQREIVRRVEGLFALADQLEERLAKARGQVDQLTPSLLARAFRGDLVSQDPNDEPAEKLLERIKERKGE
jgi:type I restriction enzyme S subunit